MTKSNNEWVPEVGVCCEWLRDKRVDWWQEGYVEYRTSSGSYVFREPNDSEYLLPLGTVFRHVKTEAEKRRESAVSELENIYVEQSTLYHSSARSLAEVAIDAGWIKPKPPTEEVIERLIDKHQNECETLCSFEFARMFESYIHGEPL